MSLRLTDNQAQQVGALLASARMTPEQIEAQNRRAYGRFTPGSKARRERAAAWRRGQSTCMTCGAVLANDEDNFCSDSCALGDPR